MSSKMLKERGVIEFRERCPYCGKDTLIVRQFEYEMPYIGRVFLVSTVCESCGYISKRAYPLEEKEPCRIEYVIDDEEDLKARVVKSDTARIEIPELGASIDPGPASQTIITNVEGILDRIRDALLAMISWAETKEEKIKGEEILKKLNEVIEGKRKATLIIEDPRGISRIIPPKGKEHKLKVSKLEIGKK